MSKAKPYLYILPAMVLALVFVYAPFFGSVLSSFFNVRFDGSFSSYAGLDNYRRALSSDIFWQSLGNTFRFMVIFVPLNIIVIMAAVLLTWRRAASPSYSSTCSGRRSES